MPYEDAKRAVQVARAYVEELFRDEPEPIENVALEEIRPNEDEGGWLVTIGFSHYWEPQPVDWSNSYQQKRRPRAYKVVCVSREGKALSLLERDRAAIP